MKAANLHKHPLVRGVKGIFDAFHDVLKNIKIFYNDAGDEEVIRGYSCSNDSELSMTDDLNCWVRNEMQHLKSATKWLEPGSIGIGFFCENATEIVLIIYYPSYYKNNKNDLILLYPKFTANPLFPSSKEFSIQDKKDIIACLMENAVKERLSCEYDIETSMEKNKKQFKRMEGYAQEIQGKSRGIQLDYVKYILNEHYKTNDIQVVLLEDAEPFIINHKGEKNELIDILKEAAEISRSMHFNTEKVELSRLVIDFAISNIEDKKLASPNNLTSPETSGGQHSLTRFFLDQLQAAMTMVNQKGEKETIKNVADCMPKGKTSAAIIDRCKKHATAIKFLMGKKNSQEVSSRWSSLRNFLPIEKILNDGYKIKKTNTPPPLTKSPRQSAQDAV